MILDPLTQIKKSQDAKRQHDLKQLQTALDTFYNDNNYYPQSVTELSAKNIQTIPSDPAATSSDWKNYAYLNDSSDGRPQWNVLFAKLAFSPSSSFACPLAQMKDSNGHACIPENYSDLGYNYCVTSGSITSIICDTIVDTPIVPLPIVPPGSGTPVPTPGKVVCYCRDAIYENDLHNQCEVVQSSPDSSLNSNRYCNPPPNGIGSCVEPCTP